MQSDTNAFSSQSGGRGIHQLSDAEKQEIADELSMQTGVFGAVVVAGVLYLALLWTHSFLF